MTIDYKEAAEKIKAGGRFLVVSHVNPEGDAIGSLLGMALALRGAGKDAVAYMEDPMPEVFKFLPGSDTVVRTLDGEAPFDATIAVDCGQKSRLGDSFNDFSGHGLIINIDHHTTNDRFGEINVVDPEASAAGEMVYDAVKEAGLTVGPDTATNLYVAIHTDTGSFRYSSSTPASFKKAGELVELGANPWEIALSVYENYPEERIRLLAEVLSTLDIVGTDGLKVATVSVTNDMFERVGGTEDLTDGFVNYARSISGVEVGVLFRESEGGEYKVSLRSKGRVDVAEIAASFGGGGHKNAAGFNVDWSLGKLKTKLEEALRAYLDKAREKV